MQLRVDPEPGRHGVAGADDDSAAASYFSDVLHAARHRDLHHHGEPWAARRRQCHADALRRTADATGTITVGGARGDRDHDGARPERRGHLQRARLSGGHRQDHQQHDRFVTVTLRKPDGSTQTSSSSSAASFNLSAQTLAVAGTYTIFVNPNGTTSGPSTSRSPAREEGLIMSSSIRRSLNSAVFIFLVSALLASRALGAAVPGQSATQLPDGRWLLLGGEGASGRPSPSPAPSPARRGRRSRRRPRA